MTCSTCPNCGYDLERVTDLQLGELAIVRGAEIWWKGMRVALTVTQVLIVCALVRADGALVKNAALAEAIGYDADGLSRDINVHIFNIRRAFLALDPAFDCIERGRGRSCRGGARWRPESVTAGASVTP